MSTLLIKNARILYGKDNFILLSNYSIYIKNNKIKKIFKTDAEQIIVDKEIDAHNNLVLPGRINSHSHFYSKFACGISGIEKSNNFVEILNNLWWKLDKGLSLTDTYLSAKSNMVNAIRTGTTCIIDHHASPSSVMGSLKEITKSAEECNFRTAVCYEISDRDGVNISEQALQETEQMLIENNNKNYNIWTANIGLHASFTLSNATLIKVAKIKNQYNSSIHIHVAEDMFDQVHCQQNYKNKVIERLNAHDLLNNKSILAHCVHIDNAEIKIIKNFDSIVVHNPTSNMNNAVGWLNIVNLMEHNILVGLGTDAMTNNMLSECRNALWLIKHNLLDPSVGFNEVTTMLLKNNAEIASRIFNDKIGFIAEDYVADLIITDYKEFTPIDSSNFLGHVIFGLIDAPVLTTIINGKIVMENGVLNNNIDEKELSLQCVEHAKKLWERIK